MQKLLFQLLFPSNSTPSRLPLSGIPTFCREKQTNLIQSIKSPASLISEFHLDPLTSLYLGLALFISMKYLFLFS